MFRQGSSPGSDSAERGSAVDRDAHVYLVGGGIASLAAAAFLIRDGDVLGHRIIILEELDRLGGSLDGAGSPEAGIHMSDIPSFRTAFCGRNRRHGRKRCGSGRSHLPEFVVDRRRHSNQSIRRQSDKRFQIGLQGIRARLAGR
jgi:MCRA family